MKKAIIDVDGVLADFEGALVERVVEVAEYGLLRDYKRDVYSLEDRYKELPDGFPGVWKEVEKFLARPSSYANLEPLYTGVKFVDDLINDGWALIFATSRPSQVYNTTQRWLCQNIRQYAKTGGLLMESNKISLAQDVGADMLVDDNPDLVKKANLAHVTAFAWEQPWNEGVFPRLVSDREDRVWIWGGQDQAEVLFFEYEFAEAK